MVARSIPVVSIVSAAVVACVASLLAPDARACSCAEVPFAAEVGQSPVIVVVEVGAARPDVPAPLPGGTGGGVGAPVTTEKVSPTLVVDAIRGARVGERFDVHWRAVTGTSCDTVNLVPGRWLLFLPTTHTIGHCAQHNRRLTRAPVVDGRVRHPAVDQVRQTLHPTTARAASAVARGVAERALWAAWTKDPRRTTSTTPSPGTWLPNALAPEVTGNPTTGWRVHWHRAPAAKALGADVVVVIAADSVDVENAAVAWPPGDGGDGLR
jgi:hypothetical protein